MRCCTPMENHCSLWGNQNRLQGAIYSSAFNSATHDKCPGRECVLRPIAPATADTHTPARRSAVGSRAPSRTQRGIAEPLPSTGTPAAGQRPERRRGRWDRRSLHLQKTATEVWCNKNGSVACKHVPAPSYKSHDHLWANSPASCIKHGNSSKYERRLRRCSSAYTPAYHPPPPPPVCP